MILVDIPALFQQLVAALCALGPIQLSAQGSAEEIGISGIFWDRFDISGIFWDRLVLAN